MKNRGPLTILLAVIAIAGLAASFRIMWKRISYEQTNRTVQIVVDLPSIMATAQNGETTEEVIDRLKAAGVYSVGVYELRAKELLERGALAINLPPPQRQKIMLRPSGTPPPLSPGTGMILTPRNEILRMRTKPYLNAYFGDAACIRDGVPCKVPDVGEKYQEISFGLGNIPTGIAITPRFFNTPFENENSIKLKLAALDTLGEPSVIIFDGSSVLGFPTMLDKVTEEIKKHPGWSVGLVEIVPQDGSSGMARNANGILLPVHSISEEELSKNPPDKAVARYMRAVRERGVRVLYVRGYTDLYGRLPGEALESNFQYIEALATAIKSEGYEVGRAVPLEPFIISKTLKAIAAAGAVAFTGLLLFSVAGFPALLSLLAAIGTTVAIVALPEGGSLLRMVEKLVALGVACFIPGLAVAKFFLPETPGETPFKNTISANVKVWIFACVVSIAGGIFTCSMLSNRDFFLRADVFSGVKLAFLFPIILISILYIKKTGWSIHELFELPLKYGEFFAALFVMAAMAIYLLRSGNEGPSAVGGFDSSIRGFLENIFVVRPRTKEFLIGHPALLAAGLFVPAKNKLAPFVILLFGVVGQVSVLNTFCHLHTPALLTWARVSMGISIGFVFGMIIRGVLKLAVSRYNMTKNALV